MKYDDSVELAVKLTIRNNHRLQIKESIDIVYKKIFQSVVIV